MSDKQVCQVCFLVDGDSSLKECTYCSVCQAYICKADENDWGRRGKAIIKKRLGKGRPQERKKCCGQK